MSTVDKVDEASVGHVQPVPRALGQHPSLRPTGIMSTVEKAADASVGHVQHVPRALERHSPLRPTGITSTVDKVDEVHFMGQVNANSFLDIVEHEFKHPNDPSRFLRYNEFISIMKAYKTSRYVLTYFMDDSLIAFFTRLSNSEVVIKICELLVGYPSLVKKFNAFLPNGYFLVPSDMREEGEPYITLKTPEGDTVYPRDYARKQLGSGSLCSSH
jgi:hypothetical protein